MNLLAHALLAYCSLPDESGETCTGALMADYFSGQRLEAYPAGIRTGIEQHRAIDAFTDGHPSFIACRKAIAASGAPRFTAGILADIFWDHVLASEWAAWGSPLCGLDLEPFCDRVYGLITLTEDYHSPRFAGAVEWIAGRRWLSSYASLDGIERTLSGLSTKMSGHPDLPAGVAILVAEDALIRSTFSAFWPELVDYARSWAERGTRADGSYSRASRNQP